MSTCEKNGEFITPQSKYLLHHFHSLTQSQNLTNSQVYFPLLSPLLCIYKQSSNSYTNAHTTKIPVFHLLIFTHLSSCVIIPFITFSPSVIQTQLHTLVCLNFRLSCVHFIFIPWVTHIYSLRNTLGSRFYCASTSGFSFMILIDLPEPLCKRIEGNMYYSYRHMN